MTQAGPAKWGSSVAVRGWVLSDPVQTIDWRERRARAIGHLRADALVEVMNRLAPLLGFRGAR